MVISSTIRPLYLQDPMKRSMCGLLFRFARFWQEKSLLYLFDISVPSVFVPVVSSLCWLSYPASRWHYVHGWNNKIGSMLNCVQSNTICFVRCRPLIIISKKIFIKGEMVKQSRKRPGVTQWVPGDLGSQISWNSVQEGDEVVSPIHRLPLHPGNVPGNHFH